MQNLLHLFNNHGSRIVLAEKELKKKHDFHIKAVGIQVASAVGCINELDNQVHNYGDRIVQAEEEAKLLKVNFSKAIQRTEKNECDIEALNNQVAELKQKPVSEDDIKTIYHITNLHRITVPDDLDPLTGEQVLTASHSANPSEFSNRGQVIRFIYFILFIYLFYFIYFIYFIYFMYFIYVFYLFIYNFILFIYIFYLFYLFIYLFYFILFYLFYLFFLFY